MGKGPGEAGFFSSLQIGHCDQIHFRKNNIKFIPSFKTNVMKHNRKGLFCFSLSLILPVFLSSALQCKEDNPEIIRPVRTTGLEVTQMRVPLFTGKDNEKIVNLKFGISPEDRNLTLEGVALVFTGNINLSGINAVTAYYSGNDGIPALYGKSAPGTDRVAIRGNRELNGENHFLNFSFALKSGADLLTRFGISEIEISFKGRDPLKVSPGGKYIHRAAHLIRAAGQDNCNTYRIPGLTTTGKGTLIAVYDNRYNNSKDLQEDIDIGMSRSTDGGQTWEPMKVIMDMGEYGGRPQNMNGAGDPCVLFDPFTNTIWVAALWMSGASPAQALWNASKPGMKPEETGQFILVKSADDGLTWSQPINITEQIKDPAWQLILQGPGNGITTKDGVLIFPAQFKEDIGTPAVGGGQYTCHSTIVYSNDSGKTWKIGTGAKSNTTEAQVVELGDGRLMLNMRDDRNRTDKGDTNGRAVAVTSDLGKTWIKHPSSNSALPEPTCMASLIATDISVNGKKQQVLFFSNPNSKTDRSHMTIKTSLDGGNTWPETFWTELNSATGYGYSCLTMVDDQTVGILYEGVKDLYFQKVPVTDLLEGLIKEK